MGMYDDDQDDDTTSSASSALLETPAGDAQALIDAMTKLSECEYVMTGGEADAVPVAIAVPQGKKLVSLKQYRDALLTAPERRLGTATFTALDSFIAHVNRFKDQHTVVFLNDANVQAPRFISVLDYHAPGEKGARFGTHRGVYAFPLSDEWKAWTHRAKADPLGQQAFAEFLEERIVDILPPGSAGESLKEQAAALGIQFASPQRLLEVSRGLSLRVEQKVTQAVNLSTGEAQINFEETHAGADGGGAVRVPAGFALAIPVFRNGPAYQVPVRLRYRVSAGRVTWSIALSRVDQIFEHALGEAAERVATETELPVLRGQPERALPLD